MSFVIILNTRDTDVQQVLENSSLAIGNPHQSYRRLQVVSRPRRCRLLPRPAASLRTPSPIPQTGWHAQMKDFQVSYAH